jgi:hypothetical protein
MPLFHIILYCNSNTVIRQYIRIPNRYRSVQGSKLGSCVEFESRPAIQQADDVLPLYLSYAAPWELLRTLSYDTP